MSWRLQVCGHIGTLEIDATLEGGVQALALVGPNGSGKSTLLRMIAGLTHATTRQLDIPGECTRIDDSSPAHGMTIGYLPQAVALFPHLRAIDNVAFGLRHGPSKVPRMQARARAQSWLEKLDCGHLAERWPTSLSGGESQKVGLARALAIEPDLLLLDEPLAALDIGARRQTRSKLARHLQTTNTPSIVVTHDLRDVVELGAKLAVLVDGSIVARGGLESLRQNPVHAFVEEFVGGLRAHDPPDVDLRKPAGKATAKTPTSPAGPICANDAHTEAGG